MNADALALIRAEPILAAAVALAIARRHAASLAYIAGSVGCLKRTAYDGRMMVGNWGSRFIQALGYRTRLLEMGVMKLSEIEPPAKEEEILERV